MEACDVLVIGAGPGGLAAAAAAKKAGAGRVVILDRENAAGGILNQCIHDGFGLIRYGSSMGGPEYAARAAEEAGKAGAELRTGLQAVSMTSDRVVTAQGREGLVKFSAGAVVLATGCRERTRGNIGTPGSRPAGVFTAGVLQNFVNIRNFMCGKRVVILGSGDIGLIMARRLTLEGAKVELVAEVLPQPCGLARNISQCLNDFGIPLLVSHTVSRILGKHRLEAVEIAEADSQLRPVPGTERLIPCDALVLSVGLIPENEVAATGGVLLDEKTGGAATDAFLQTSVPGVFACGNCRRVMDLADFVSEQGTLAGSNAAAFLQGRPMQTWQEERGNTMVKGFPEPGSTTCPLCPNGCQVRFDAAAGTFSGNRCPRGAAFAAAELKKPVRVLTTTLRLAAQPGETGPARLVPVRSTEAVEKALLPEAVSRLRGVTVDPPVRRGDILCTLSLGGQDIAFAAQTDVR